ncbi:unnamed protein product [Amoebophrya sp. A120]|nr:unnamed protein product [Amoebophrya sp. A120]|eukprot:GSA120T00009626001.1
MADVSDPSATAEAKKPVVVIGGGLVGCLCAVLLQKTEKFQVTVYERYSDIRTIPTGAGRSINLVMTRRGLKAAELLGMKEDLVNLSVKVRGRTMHQLDRSQVFQKYGREEDCNYSVSRYELNCFLLKEAERLGVDLLFGYKLKSADFGMKAPGGDKSKNSAKVENANPDYRTKLVFIQTTDATKNAPKSHSTSTTDEAPTTAAPPTDEQLHSVELDPHTPVFGCDGGPSGLRYSLRDQGFLTFKEEILGQSYRELIFPKNSEGGYCMEPSALHIWPRRTHMMMGLADRGGTFTGTLYVDNDAWPQDTKEAEEFFQQHYPSSVPLLGGMESACEQLLRKKPGILGTIFTSKYNLHGKALLLGDSAHAIVPFFGQGCNCGFEDCVILDDLLKKQCEKMDRQNVTAKDFTFDEFWYPVFEEFHALRKPSADAIAKLALENFVEMRELVGDREFLKCKHVEKILEMKIPEKFRSRYSLVCYGSAAVGGLSYANAFELGQVIKEVILEIVLKCEEVMNGGGSGVSASTTASEEASEETKDVGSDKPTTSPLKEYIYDWTSLLKDAEKTEQEVQKLQEDQDEMVLKYGEPLVDARIVPKCKELGMDLGLIYA